jgi:hypothetical protein
MTYVLPTTSNDWQQVARGGSKWHEVAELTAGLSIGNGSVKLALESTEIYMHSYLYDLHKGVSEIPANGFVRYVTGDRNSLNAAEWIGGFHAYQFAPKSAKRVCDTPDGKIEYALHLLLSALVELPYSKEINLKVVCAIHDAEVLGESLSDAIAGTHIVKLGDNDASTIVRIQVLKVLNEDAASLIDNRTLTGGSGLVSVIGIGNGTVNGSVFGDQGVRIGGKVFHLGVEDLISRICRSADIRAFRKGQEGDRHLVRRGIEQRNFSYGTTGYNFETSYRLELKPWLSEALAPVTRYLSEWEETADVKLAIGGGCLLPIVDQVLTQKGYTIALDPVWSDTRGLLKIAQHLVNREV